MILIVSPVALLVDPAAAPLAPEPAAALLAQPARARAATQANEPAMRERDFMRVLLGEGLTGEKVWERVRFWVASPSEDSQVRVAVLRRAPPQQASFESGDEELGQERD